MFELDLRWKNENELVDGEYWIGGKKCRVYTKVFDTGLDYCGCDVSGLEVVCVPIELADIVDNGRVGELNRDEAWKYERFIDDHTFYVNGREMRDDWYDDYKMGGVWEDACYVSRHTEMIICRRSSRFPVLLSHLVMEFLSRDLETFKLYVGGM